jgi:tripartite-type tricarboxylate transporter receptor subunit TctC
MFSKNIQINSTQIFSRRSVLKMGSTLSVSMGLMSMGSMAQSLKGTVKLIVPFTAGSGPDIVSRILAPKLTTLWDTTVIVENKAGASGTIGADLVAKSPADGHTLMVGPASSITGPHL